MTGNSSDLLRIEAIRLYPVGEVEHAVSVFSQATNTHSSNSGIRLDYANKLVSPGRLYEAEQRLKAASDDTKG